MKMCIEEKRIVYEDSISSYYADLSFYQINSNLASILCHPIKFNKAKRLFKRIEFISNEYEKLRIECSDKSIDRDYANSKMADYINTFPVEEVPTTSSRQLIKRKEKFDKKYA